MNKDNEKVKQFVKINNLSKEFGLSESAIRSTSHNRPELIKFLSIKIDEMITGGKQLLKIAKKSK